MTLELLTLSLIRLPLRLLLAPEASSSLSLSMLLLFVVLYMLCLDSRPPIGDSESLLGFFSNFFIISYLEAFFSRLLIYTLSVAFDSALSS